MRERLMVPVSLDNADGRYYEPSLSRLPEWLDRLAAKLHRDDGTADLYMQEVAGAKNWAAILRELLAQARRVPTS